MLVKKEVFKEVGLLDEDYFLYWEDVDFSLRAKKAKFKKIIVTSSWVYHFEKSEKNRENKVYWLVASGIIFFKKNTSPHLKPWIMLYLQLRRIKNWLDVLFGSNALAPIVKKAHADFKNEKF